MEDKSIFLAVQWQNLSDMLPESIGDNGKIQIKQSGGHFQQTLIRSNSFPCNFFDEFRDPRVIPTLVKRKVIHDTGFLLPRSLRAVKQECDGEPHYNSSPDVHLKSYSKWTTRCWFRPLKFFPLFLITLTR